MLDRDYQYYWNIMLSVGITKFIYNTLAMILIYTIAKDSTISIFEDYFEINYLGISISKFIINITFQFFGSTLQILTIFSLSPEFLLISQNVGNTIFSFKYGNNNKYICIIFFLLQFFSLMIYLEIIELNFCNLNKNTKRNIKLRINDELIERTDSLMNGKFEAGNGYIFENEENEECEESEEDDEHNLNAELNLLQTKDNNKLNDIKNNND